MLRDDQWARIEVLCSGKSHERGVTGRNNRLFVEAVLWIARTGAPRHSGAGCGNCVVIVAEAFCMSAAQRRALRLTAPRHVVGLVLCQNSARRHPHGKERQ